MDDDALEDRLHLIDDRLDHYVERLEVLEQAKKTERDEEAEQKRAKLETKRHRRGVIMEVIVIALIVIEVLQYYFPHHG